VQKVKFNPVDKISELSVQPPKPARNYIPEWYKSIPAFRDGKISNGAKQKTIKLCAPFADSLNLGYIQETWQEINIYLTDISENEKQIDYKYPIDPPIMSLRKTWEDSENSFAIPPNYYPFEFSWHPAWIPELPEGYSALITHPLNRPDLPFYTMTGIVDSDSFGTSRPQSNLPFLLNKNFTGILPVGTPMYQIIPFKRDDWKSSTTEFNEERQFKDNQKIRRHLFQGYKKEHWHKKNFS